MEPQELLDRIKDPEAWRGKSIALRRAADTVWDGLYVRELVEYGRLARVGAAGADRIFQQVFDDLETAKMLYGLALETAFKGYLLRTRPDAVESQLRVDAAGTPLEAHIKQIGVPTGRGHDLVRLAEEVGALEAPPGVSKDSQTVLRDVLLDLAECVMWRARYPVPLKSGKTFMPSDGVPTLLFHAHLRDVVDPLLDQYQANLPTSS